MWATFLGEIGKIPEKSADLGEVPGVWSMVGPVFPDVGLKLLYDPGHTCIELDMDMDTDTEERTNWVLKAHASSRGEVRVTLVLNWT